MQLEIEVLSKKYKNLLALNMVSCRLREGQYIWALGIKWSRQIYAYEAVGAKYTSDRRTDLHGRDRYFQNGRRI